MLALAHVLSEIILFSPFFVCYDIEGVSISVYFLQRVESTLGFGIELHLYNSSFRSSNLIGRVVFQECWCNSPTATKSDFSLFASLFVLDTLSCVIVVYTFVKIKNPPNCSLNSYLPRIDGWMLLFLLWMDHPCMRFILQLFFWRHNFLLKCHNLIFHVFLQLTAGFRSRGLPSVMPVGGSKWLSLRAINWITHSTHWFLSGTIK